MARVDQKTHTRGSSLEEIVRVIEPIVRLIRSPDGFVDLLAPELSLIFLEKQRFAGTDKRHRNACKLLRAIEVAHLLGFSVQRTHVSTKSSRRVERDPRLTYMNNPADMAPTILGDILKNQIPATKRVKVTTATKLCKELAPLGVRSVMEHLKYVASAEEPGRLFSGPG